MSKTRSPLLDFAVYLLVRWLVAIIQALSAEGGRCLAHGLAWLAYYLDRRHRQVADENLRHAFPGRYTDQQRQALVRAVYLHFATVLVEILHMPRKLHVTTWRRHIELAEGRQILDCLLSGRPLMFVTGHFGNWELGGYALGLLGFSTHAVARPLDNPYLDRFLRTIRERTGQRLLAKKGDFDQMQAILAQGGILATLADQDAGPRGLFVDFFNRPASTHKAIALLALEFQVPLLVLGTPRVGQPFRYQVQVQDLILPEEYAGKPDALRAITQRFTTALQRQVQAYPEQYFWLHRRWKHQPGKNRRKAA